MGKKDIFFILFQIIKKNPNNLDLIKYGMKIYARFNFKKFPSSLNKDLNLTFQVTFTEGKFLGTLVSQETKKLVVSACKTFITKASQFIIFGNIKPGEQKPGNNCLFMLSTPLLGVVAYLDSKDNSKRSFTQAECILQSVQIPHIERQ